MMRPVPSPTISLFLSVVSEMMRDKSRPTSQVKRPPPEETVKPVMRYSPMVKVGNWQEAKDVAEEELLGFLRLRERGQLAVQKTREVLSQALKQINLPPKKLIYFGDKLQLLARKAKVSGSVVDNRYIRGT